MSPFHILITYRWAFIRGMSVTLELALITWFSGLVLGSVFGILGARWPAIIGWPCRIASFFLSGIPMLVFLFWIHYPLQGLLGVVVDPFYTAALTLSTVNVFCVADIIRSVLRDFPSQYVVAARVCGIPRIGILLHILFPIVFRQVLPSLLALQVTMLQSTLFASLISVQETFRVAQQINSTIYRPIEIYTALAMLFLVICLPLNGLAAYLHRRYAFTFSEG